MWQAHQMCWKSGRYCTVQLRCVQTAENARTSPVAVRTRIPGFAPKRKILPEFGGSSESLPARTRLTGASATSGGITKRKTG